MFLSLECGIDVSDAFLEGRYFTYLDGMVGK
jgi:hypothetical protein